jgi:HEAT repeat protein
VLIAQIEHRDQLDQPTYAWAARALGLYGVHARRAVPALVDLLFDEEIPQGYRMLPMEALARIGTRHPEVMPALLRLLQYQGEDATKVSPAEASVFRELAAEAIAVVGADADLAAPLLVRAIRNPQETAAVRRKAIVAVGALGPRAELAVPALIETMELGDTEALRVAASEALGKIGTPALPLLQQYLQHPAPDVRCYAAQGLAAMGPQARPALAALTAALADPHAEVRMAICESCAAIPLAPDTFMRQLIELLASDSRQVRMRAMRLLIKLGPQVDPFLPQLQALQSHHDSSVRAIARKTWEQLER